MENIIGKYNYDVRTIKIKDISINEEIYPRSAVDTDTVDKYAVAFSLNEKFPPIIVLELEENTKYALIDGYHRLKAREKNNQETITAYVVKDKISENEMFAISVEVNARHGKSFTLSDKMRISEILNQKNILNKLSQFVEKFLKDEYETEFSIDSLLEEIDKHEDIKEEKEVVNNKEDEEFLSMLETEEEAEKEKVIERGEKKKIEDEDDEFSEFSKDIEEDEDVDLVEKRKDKIEGKVEQKGKQKKVEMEEIGEIVKKMKLKDIDEVVHDIKEKVNISTSTNVIDYKFSEKDIVEEFNEWENKTVKLVYMLSGLSNNKVFVEKIISTMEMYIAFIRKKLLDENIDKEKDKKLLESMRKRKFVN